MHILYQPEKRNQTACFFVFSEYTKWAFVIQCNYDAKKNNDPDFKPKGGNQKVTVGAGGEAYGITIDGNAKSARKTMTQLQNIFEEDVSKLSGK